MVRHTTSTGASIRTSPSITRPDISLRSFLCASAHVAAAGVTTCRSSPALELQPKVACQKKTCNQCLQLVHHARPLDAQPSVAHPEETCNHWLHDGPASLSTRQAENWRQGNGCTHRPDDELYLHDLHSRHARAGLAGPHRPRLHEALLAAPKGWREDLPFGLEEGLDLRPGAPGGRARRERPRAGDPRVRS